jgi:hypothetical protein
MKRVSRDRKLKWIARMELKEAESIGFFRKSERIESGKEKGNGE